MKMKKKIIKRVGVATFPESVALDNFLREDDNSVVVQLDDNK